MSVSQINSSSPLLPKNHPLNPQPAITAEQSAAFEASLDAPPETAGENLSQDQTDSSVPTASWDIFWKGFNQSIFDHDRRELACHDQQRREIDYGNKP